MHKIVNPKQTRLFNPFESTTFWRKKHVNGCLMAGDVCWHTLLQRREYSGCRVLPSAQRCMRPFWPFHTRLLSGYFFAGPSPEAPEMRLKACLELCCPIKHGYPPWQSNIFSWCWHQASSLRKVLLELSLGKYYNYVRVCFKKVFCDKTVAWNWRYWASSSS